MICTDVGRAPIRLSIAAANDLPEVRALAAEGEGIPRWPAEAWESFVGLPGATARAAVLLLGRDGEDRVRGLLAGTVLGESADLECVWVCPSERRRGLGGRLLARWMQWAGEHGAQEIFLEVRAGNAGALSLYRRLGFVEGGRRRGYYRDPLEDAVTMRLSPLRDG